MLSVMKAADLLRACRTRAGITQRSLADAARTSQPTIAAYEAGRVTPNVDTFERLLEACGCTLQVADAEAPRWSRVEEKSLAIHRLIAARLLSSPSSVLEKARSNLTSLRPSDRGHAARLLEEWAAILDQPLDAIVTAMLARTQHGIDLRQMTPFAGVLTDDERRKALRSVQRTGAA